MVRESPAALGCAVGTELQLWTPLLGTTLLTVADLAAAGWDHIELNLCSGQVFVKTLTGKTITLDTSFNDTIAVR
jgi:hypothetical protein